MSLSTPSPIDRVDNLHVLGLSILDSIINEMSILRLLSSSQDQRGVGGSILGLVLGNGYIPKETRSAYCIRHCPESLLTFKITGIGNNGGEFLELFEDRHDVYKVSLLKRYVKRKENKMLVWRKMQCFIYQILPARSR